MTKYNLGVGDTVTRVWESGAGRPVLLVHDLGLRADWWRHNLGPLAEAGFRAIAVDLPGHGFAEKPGAVPAELDSYAEFVDGLVQALDLDRPLVVAAGASARIVGRCLNLSARRWGGALFIGPMGVVEMQDADVLSAMRDMSPSRPNVIAKLLRSVADRTTLTEEWAEEEYRIQNSPGGPEALAAAAALLEELLGKPDAVELAEAADGVPVGLLWGERDRVAPVSLAAATTAATRVRMMTSVPAAGHAVQYERPGALTDAVRHLAAESFR